MRHGKRRLLFAAVSALLGVGIACIPLPPEPRPPRGIAAQDPPDAAPMSAFDAGAPHALE